LIAVVVNDVDDALSSKERRVLGERSLRDDANEALLKALLTTVEHHWQMLITADHGHTPYREPDVTMKGL
jgi:hypothetical protein